jgi:hypothetical protein
VAWLCSYWGEKNDSRVNYNFKRTNTTSTGEAEAEWNMRKKLK